MGKSSHMQQACLVLLSCAWVAEGRRATATDSSMKVGQLVKESDSQTYDPVVLGALVASGCAWGAAGGIAEFKSDSAVFSNLEIAIVLDKIKEGVQTIAQVLKFKDDDLSRFAKWDFDWWVSEMLTRIGEATPKHNFDMEALDLYSRRVKVTWNKFARNFYEYHHISALAPDSGRGVCSTGRNGTCEALTMSLDDDIPESLRHAYHHPCEKVQGQCLAKKSLLAVPWAQSLETLICSQRWCTCVDGQPCVLIPSPNGTEIGMGEELTQQRACQSANAAAFETQEQALERMRGQDSKVSLAMSYTSEIDPFKVGMTMASLALVAKNLGQELGNDLMGDATTGGVFNAYVAQMGFLGATGAYIAGWSIWKVTGMVCQVATAKVIHMLPRPVQQVVVNILQPIFSIRVLANAAQESFLYGSSSELLNAFNIAERKSELRAGQCKAGQVQFAVKHLFHIANVTLEQCRKICERREDCWAFDYSQKHSSKRNACRGVPWNYPRLDVRGIDLRTYCQVRTAPPQCAKEGNNCTCNGKVRFGNGENDETWTEWQSAHGDIPCKKDSFGGKDPLPMRKKRCQCISENVEGETMKESDLRTCLTLRERFGIQKTDSKAKHSHTAMQNIDLSLAVAMDKFNTQEERKIENKEIAAWAAGSDVWHPKEEEEEEEEEQHICSEMGAFGLYFATVWLGGCRMQVEVLPGEREIFGGLGVVPQGLAPYQRSLSIQCSHLNPNYKGSFFIRCFEEGPNAAYKKLAWFIQTKCRRLQNQASSPRSLSSPSSPKSPRKPKYSPWLTKRWSSRSQELRGLFRFEECPSATGHVMTHDLDPERGVTLRIRQLGKHEWHM